MKGVLETLALCLKARGALDVREAFIDGSFAPAKKGAPRLEKQSAAKARKSCRACRQDPCFRRHTDVLPQEQS